MRTLLNVRMAMVVAVSAVVMAACGGAGSASSPTMPSLADASSGGGDTTTTVASNGEDALLEYAACMRENGVDMPDPSSHGGGFVIEGTEGDFADHQAADAVCSPLLEGAFGAFEMTPEQVAEMRDQDLAFAQCMRDEGIDWPDPSSDGTTSFQLSTDDFDPEAMEQATDTCAEEVFGETLGGFTSIDSVSSTP